MTSISTRVGTVVTVVALAVGVPAASASAAIFPFALPARAAFPAGAAYPGLGTNATNPLSPCGIGAAPGESRSSGSNNQACVGAGLVFQGPQIGQIANVVGPTMIGPTVGATVIVTAGNAGPATG